MCHVVLFKRPLVIGLEPGSSRPLVVKPAVRSEKQSAQNQSRGAVAFNGVVARDVVKITEEKAAKVYAGAVLSAESGRG